MYICLYVYTSMNDVVVYVCNICCISMYISIRHMYKHMYIHIGICDIMNVDDRLTAIEQSFKPTLSGVREFFSTRVLIDAGGKQRTPLIGEESAALQTFLHFVISEKPVLVNSYSGTGKTVLVDAVLDMIPEDEKFSIQQGSDTSAWYNAGLINKARYVEFPELQKATQNISILEILKNWGEGKDAKREKTDIIKEQMGENAVDEQILRWHPFITSAAIGNKSASPIIEDDEFMRRILEVRTDPSMGMTKRVVNYKLKQWGTIDEDAKHSPFEMVLMKNHVRDVIHDAPRGFYNPAYSCFEDVIPTSLPVARSFVDNLISVCNAVTRFYYKDGIMHKGKLIVRPQDMYEASRIYMRDFIEGCLKLPLLGREILGAFPPLNQSTLAETAMGAVLDESKLTAAQVADKLESVGFSIDEKSVTRILAHLCMNHFLRREDVDRKKSYYRSEHTANYENRVDWDKVIDMCIENSPCEEYVEQCCGASILLTDPIEGTEVDMRSLERAEVSVSKKGVDIMKLVG